ncbi:MAG: ferritin-like protein [Ferruginibacter sp.]|nr:ferritin-like protein [Ferruginibacter sp.]
MATKKKAAVKKAATAPKKSGSGIKEFFPVKDSMLEKFFQDELKDIYWAEKHLTKTLPRMEKAATNVKLKAAFKNHLAETKVHITRLEQVFSMLGLKAQAKKCEAMEGITKEGSGIIEETKTGTSTRDVGLILAAQKVEHYEISTYGGLIQLAKTLGLEDCAEVMVQTLNEEKLADEGLTDIAENGINYQSSQEKAPATKK